MAVDVSGFLRACEERKLEMHSLVVRHHGEPVARHWWLPFRPEDEHYLYSLSKSFCSTAIGLLIDEGRLSLDSRAIDIFPDKVPANPSENLAKLNVDHLLKMSLGQASDSLWAIKDSDDWMSALLHRDFPNEPGSVFLYDSGATYALAAIHHRITGEGLVEYLTPRLFEPLGITEATWTKDPSGIDIGGVGLSLTTDSISRFGQLLLQQGRWGARQLIPADWIARATSKQIDNSNTGSGDWAAGYCYQYWRCVPDGVFRGDGAFGQLCLVAPELDTVVAITSCIDDFQLLLDTCYEFLLFGTEPTSEPDRPLIMAEIRGDATPSGDVLGNYSKLAIDSNTLSIDGHSYPIRSEWVVGAYDFWRRESLPVATSAAWTSPTQLKLKIQQLTYPANTELTFEFRDNAVIVTPHMRGVLAPRAEDSQPWHLDRHNS